MRRCRYVGAHVRCARATQMQALDYPSLAVDRTNRKDDNAIVFFYFQFLFFKKLEVFLKIC